MIIPRRRYVGIVSSCLLVILFTTFYFHSSVSLGTAPPIVETLKPPPSPPKPKYKEQSRVQPPPVVDNFPLAQAAHSAAELPPIPKWSSPPATHVSERTPLFIGFTRNWRLLQQVVVGYITAGWPPEDIYVVENTGVMDSNKLGLLSLQNPFFLNHTRLNMLGVNVLITPTLFTFAQLQNFYLWISTVEKYPYYFWSHMDVVVLPYEENMAKHNDMRSLYNYCVEALHEVLEATDEKTGNPFKWAMRFFSYDRLALVNVESFRAIGGWDTMIPFYMTDCDMHARLDMAGYNIQEKPAGMIYDVGSSVDDLIVFYRKKSGPNGFEVPKVSWKDPKVLEAELKAMDQGERQLEKAGWNHDAVSPRSIESKSWLKPKIDPQTGVSRRDDTIFDHFAIERSAAPTMGEREASDWVDDTTNSEVFWDLVHTLERMQNSKNTGERNDWQARQKGGKGEPFYRDSAGFEEAIRITIEHGRHIYREKWGHRDCDIVAMGLKPEDAWLVLHDGDW